METATKKVLLIDDEEVILFGFKQVIAGPNRLVDTASTLADAIKLAGENNYDAAIIDLRLSNSTALEGLDLIAFIKKSQKKCRVIVLTAYGDDEVRRKSLDAGADRFLEKPVNPETIIKIIEQWGLSEPGCSGN